MGSQTVMSAPAPHVWQIEPFDFIALKERRLGLHPWQRKTAAILQTNAQSRHNLGTKNYVGARKKTIWICNKEWKTLTKQQKQNLNIA